MPVCRASPHIPMDQQRNSDKVILSHKHHKPTDMPCRPPHRLTWPYISLALAFMLFPEWPPEIILSNYDLLDLITTKYGTISHIRTCWDVWNGASSFEMVSHQSNAQSPPQKHQVKCQNLNEESKEISDKLSWQSKKTSTFSKKKQKYIYIHGGFSQLSYRECTPFVVRTRPTSPPKKVCCGLASKNNTMFWPAI